VVHTTTGTYLDRILANTVDEVRERMSTQPQEALAELIDERPEPASLAAALTAVDEVSVIAEFKRASPSKGLIAGDAGPADIVAEYVRGGCAAISVLTDEKFFQGSLADLRIASEIAGTGETRRPVLRKDFVVSPYQIVEARVHGADAILLIVAALPDDQLMELHTLAAGLGMDSLVEIHAAAELERAVAVNPKVIGINNRDLRTFDVDLATTERLAPQVPDGIAVVGESGVGSRNDVLRLGEAGVDAVLVGESLMRQPDRAAAVRELLGR
jgi:indole-3-glycerol phosphate synthase